MQLAGRHRLRRLSRGAPVNELLGRGSRPCVVHIPELSESTAEKRRGWVTALGMLLSPVVVLAAGALAWTSATGNNEALQRSNDMSLNAQRSAQLTTAMSLMGEMEPHTRVGGIYNLLSLVESQEGSHWAASCRTLEAFVVSRAPSTGSAAARKLKVPSRELIDVVSAIDVLGSGCTLVSPFDRLSLSKVNLSNKHLNRLDIYRTDLKKADLYGAQLVKTNLWKSDLRDADLTCANLTGARLGGTDLRGVSLVGASLTGASYDQETLWPNGVAIAPSKKGTRILSETPEGLAGNCNPPR